MGRTFYKAEISTRTSYGKTINETLYIYCNDNFLQLVNDKGKNVECNGSDSFVRCLTKVLAREDYEGDGESVRIKKLENGMDDLPSIVQEELRGESKMIVIYAYCSHPVFEVVYPRAGTNAFEKELLERIVTNAFTGIVAVMKSGDEQRKKELEQTLHDRWMSIVGVSYWDDVTRVKLSQYERQSQVIYKVEFCARFIYD